MKELILKTELEESKMIALLSFLKSLGIDAELKTSTPQDKRGAKFSLAAGLWKDYPITGENLRKQAWEKNL